MSCSLVSFASSKPFVFGGLLVAAGVAASMALGLVGGKNNSSCKETKKKFSNPNQPQRFADGKKENNLRDARY